MIEILIWIYNHTIAPVLFCAILSLPFVICSIALYAFYHDFAFNKRNIKGIDGNHFSASSPPNFTSSSSDMFHNITTYTTSPIYSNLPSNISHDRCRN